MAGGQVNFCGGRSNSEGKDQFFNELMTEGPGQFFCGGESIFGGQIKFWRAND